MAGNTSRENGKKGGRPKGSKSQTTIEREIALKELRERVVRSYDALLNSQMAIAHGLTFLYVIKTIKSGKGMKRLKPKLIKDQATIEAYLAGELDKDEHEYYFMSTQRPDNKAIDSLLDRTFGKAQQNMDVTSDGKALTISLIKFDGGNATA